MSQWGAATLGFLCGGAAFWLWFIAWDLIKNLKECDRDAMETNLRNELRSWMTIHLAREVSVAKADMVAMVHALHGQKRKR